MVASRARLLILGMLFVTVTINYLDRSNLSIAAPAMRHDLGLDTVRMGWVLSAFGWTYAFCQIPGGWLVDRVAPRFLYAGLMIGWSLATMLLGFAGSLIGLILLRLLIGAMEAPSYPINNRIVTAWFPNRERASAIGAYTSGQFFGLAFLIPLLLWLEARLGWHMIFFATGLTGMAWGVIFLLFYREPRQFALANAAEVAAIQAGGGLVDIGRKGPRTPFTRADFAQVFASRKLWGVYLGQFALTSTQWFFLTWFPTYLIEFRHISYVQSGILASLPFLAAFFGVLSGGLISDFLLRQGASLGLARKAPVITGLLLSGFTIGANYVDAPGAVIGFMTVAFFGNGMASIAWSLISTLAPPRLIGLTGGTFNFISNLSAITTPLVIGYLAQGGNFAPGLVYIGTLALLGALSYLFVVGKVEAAGNRDVDGRL
jgi:ACS family D-galactonate transporter-like MFS transporter